MKNWKVKKKLLFNMGVLLFIMLCILCTSIIGMKFINEQNILLQAKTIPNNNSVLEMRKEMIYNQRFILLALDKENDDAVTQSLNTSTQNSKNIETVFQKYLTNYGVDKIKAEKLAQPLTPMSNLRKDLINLIEKNPENADMEAMTIFKNQYKPLHDEFAKTLKEIGNDQVYSANIQAAAATKIYKIACVSLFIVFLVAIVVSGVVVRKLLICITAPLADIEKATQLFLTKCETLPENHLGKQKKLHF